MIAKTFQAAVDPALALLPDRMDTPEARALLAAIMLQESEGTERHQIGGPAHGLWQFEEGTRQSRGGVWGVYLHDRSAGHLMQVCRHLRVPYEPAAIFDDLEFDDVLAAAVARLLLWTDPRELPRIGDADGAWAYYIRNWRPGKPHPDKWAHNYARALEIAR